MMTHRFLTILIALVGLVGSACDRTVPEIGGGPDDPPWHHFPADAGLLGPDPFPGAPPAAGPIGATPGGAQDFSYVREVITSGGVPDPSDIRTEGLLSEHDLPVEGEPCDSLLCVRPARAVAPSFDTGEVTGEDQVWIHIGFSSGIDPEAERAPLDLVVLVDESGSMASDIQETWDSVLNIAGHLGERDRLAVLGFADGVRDIRPLSPVSSAEDVRREIGELRAEGGWNLDAAIEAAFDTARADQREGALTRVILYTCGYPTVGGVFEQQTRAGASDGIATTVVGVILGYEGTLAEYLGGLRGGNYFYTSSLAEIRNFLEEDFELLMLPLAYDFELAIQEAAGFELQKAYGLPHDESGRVDTTIVVETLFASRRQGAIALRFGRTAEPAAGDSIASIELGYEPAVGGGFVDQTAEVSYPELSETPYFDGTGTRKLVALVNLVEGMRRASLRYWSASRWEAASILDDLIEYFEAEAAALTDEDIDRELELLRALRSNVTSAPPTSASDPDASVPWP